jgi:hypothetical protein
MCTQGLVRKPEERRLLGRPRCRWERIILNWILEKWNGGGCVDWIDPAKDRNRWRWWALVNVVMNPWVPSNVGNFSSS